MNDFTTLSLDLGSTLGYCLGKNGVIMDSGEVTLSAKDSHPGHRWMKFQRWLEPHKNVSEILFEDVQFITSTQQMKVYGGLLAVLQIFTLAHKIRSSSLGPSQIKKDFTGAGNAKKEIVCEVAMNLGWKNGVPNTANCNNEADAIALFWVVSVRRGIKPAFNYQSKIIDLS